MTALSLWNQVLESEYGTRTQAFYPPCDVEENADAFQIHFDAPGVHKNDLKIELADQHIVVTGERKQEVFKSEDKTARRFSERRYGKFKRTFELPPNVDFAQVTADFKDGVLSISIPKSAQAKARQITIGSGVSNNPAA